MSTDGLAKRVFNYILLYMHQHLQDQAQRGSVNIPKNRKGEIQSVQLTTEKMKHWNLYVAVVKAALQSSLKWQ